eukprot:7258557-Prymnesium_polylepis.1
MRPEPTDILRVYASIANVHQRRALEALVDVVSALRAVAKHVLETGHPGAFERAVACIEVSPTWAAPDGSAAGRV